MISNLFVSILKLYGTYGWPVVFAYVSEKLSKRAGIKHDGVCLTLGELHPSALSVKLAVLVNIHEMRDTFLFFCSCWISVVSEW